MAIALAHGRCYAVAWTQAERRILNTPARDIQSSLSTQDYFPNIPENVSMVRQSLKAERTSDSPGILQLCKS
jgi:hypothetical protein